MNMSGTDDAGLRLHSTLSLQLELIRALEAKLGHVLDSLPKAASGVWRGPAHEAYESAIEQLANAVARVAIDVERAAAATRRAAARAATGA